MSIEFGLVPANLPGPTERGPAFELAAATALIDVSPVARFLVTDGHRILVEPGPGASEVSLRWRILGPAFGALLQQRGRLALHATVVAMPAGAIGLVGHSGAGKSTLAASLAQRGHRLLLDDVCVTSLQDGVVWVEPGSARIRLWEDAIAALGLLRGERLVPEFEKFELIAVEPPQEPFPLSALVGLTLGDRQALTALGSPERLSLCLLHTYRREYLAGMGCAPANFARCAALAGSLPAFRLSRPAGLGEIGNTIRLLEQTFGEKCR